MNENINLCEILKDCPINTGFYSPIIGDCKLSSVNSFDVVVANLKGTLHINPDATATIYGYKTVELMLLPSQTQRDWSKWKYPKPKFDPKTLKPFDRVLVSVGGKWQCDLFSHMLSGDIFNKRCIGVGDINVVIPYNDDTKHLVGTANEAPDFYRYWENSINNRRFNPKTLKLNDKVLVRDEFTYSWASAYFNHIKEDSDYPYMTTRSAYRYCIPYNNDTKHLDGRKEQAPEFYRYWED